MYQSPPPDALDLQMQAAARRPRGDQPPGGAARPARAPAARQRGGQQPGRQVDHPVQMRGRRAARTGSPRPRRCPPRAPSTRRRGPAARRCSGSAKSPYGHRQFRRCRRPRRTPSGQVRGSAPATARGRRGWAGGAAARQYASVRVRRGRAAGGAWRRRAGRPGRAPTATRPSTASRWAITPATVVAAARSPRRPRTSAAAPARATRHSPMSCSSASSRAVSASYGAAHSGTGMRGGRRLQAALQDAGAQQRVEVQALRRCAAGRPRRAAAAPRPRRTRSRRGAPRPPSVSRPSRRPAPRRRAATSARDGTGVEGRAPAPTAGSRRAPSAPPGPPAEDVPEACRSCRSVA